MADGKISKAEVEESKQVSGIGPSQISLSIPSAQPQKWHYFNGVTHGRPSDVTLTLDAKGRLFGKGICCFTNEWNAILDKDEPILLSRHVANVEVTVHGFIFRMKYNPNCPRGVHIVLDGTCDHGLSQPELQHLRSSSSCIVS